MQRVLITGATGMVGANLARKLIADGFRVSVLARPNSNRVRLREIENELHFVSGDLTNERSVQKAVDEAAPNIVYHLAGTAFNPPTNTPRTHFLVNVLGTLALIESVRRNPATKFIYTGTAAVYEPGGASREDQRLQPSTILGASKAAASLLLQACAKLYGIRTIELRLFMPYGPWEHSRRLIPQAILAALGGQDLPMSLGQQQRDLVYIDDVVEALLLAANSGAPSGSVYNIGSGTGTQIRNVVSTIFDLVGTNARLLLGALPTRSDEIMMMSADISRSHDELGWKPRTTLEQGLQKTITWIQDHRSEMSELDEALQNQAA